MQRHGGRLLVEQLETLGVRRLFSVPGESFLAVLDGLYQSPIDNIVCRHEGGAAMMAEAMGKMTGTPGIAFVTRGPGAANAAAGVHIARQDSTPMILFIGQIERGHRDREAFQEVDYRAMFGPLAKWAAEIDDVARIPEYLTRAWAVAQSGRPGPVVLALPEDMLAERTDVPVRPAPDVGRPAVPDGLAGRIGAFLQGAARPLVVVGGPLWSQAAADDLRRFAEAARLPVVATFRRQDRIDNASPAYVGDIGVGMNPRLAERLSTADRLLILGARFGDIATGGYRLIDPAGPQPRIAHVHPDASVPNSVYSSELTVIAQPGDVAAALAAAPPAGDWGDWAAAARADYEAWSRPRQTPGRVKMETVVGWLRGNLPEDAILTNGAGNYAVWLHRYYPFHRAGTQLAPTSGSMGYGFPAAVAASLEHPDRVVVCMAGDGCFQMTLNEMSTAVQHGAAPVVIVANNGRYGTIRMHQERSFPGRPSGTDLANPDFAALARAYGGHGERVEDDAAFPEAFARARASGRPAVIELVLDPEALTAGSTLSEIRAASENSV